MEVALDLHDADAYSRTREFDRPSGCSGFDASPIQPKHGIQGMNDTTLRQLNESMSLCWTDLYLKLENQNLKGSDRESI